MNKAYRGRSRAGGGLLALLLGLLFLSACSDGAVTSQGGTQGAAVVPGIVTKATAVSTAQPAQGNPAKQPATTAAARPAQTQAATVTLPADAKLFPWGGRGKVWDQYFFSPILNRQMSYRIYMPPDYFTDTSKRYPVLYMLHGLAGSYQEWVDYGLLPNADDMIAAGQIPSFIIVLPLGEQGYWMNHANGGPRWADYLTTDVVGHVDSHYRTLTDPDDRAIGGHSMGGHGALQIAFNNPKLFGIIGAHSPTLRTKDQAFYYWGDDNYYKTIDPVSLAQVKDLSSYKIWLDIGDQDTDWLPRTQTLYQILQQRGADVTWHLWPGNHGGEYWIAHCKDYITFYANSFAASAGFKG